MIALAIRTDEERLKRLRSEILALEKEKSAMFSEVSSQRAALGEIARSTQEEIRQAQAAIERANAAKYELEATTRTIAANRIELESLSGKLEEAKAISESIAALKSETERKNAEMAMVKVAIANEKGVLTGILQEQESAKRAFESREAALKDREFSVFTRERNADGREKSLNEFYGRLDKRDAELKLKMKRLQDYAETIGIKITYSTDDRPVEE